MKLLDSFLRPLTLNLVLLATVSTAGHMTDCFSYKCEINWVPFPAAGFLQQKMSGVQEKTGAEIHSRSWQLLHFKGM